MSRRWPQRVVPHNSLGDWTVYIASGIVIWGGVLLLILFLWLAIFKAAAHAKDDGRFQNSPLKSWFDSLSSGKGLCCSFADGVSVKDVDWDTKDGKFRVRLDGQWIVVPDDAVVAQPNKFGPAVVWPYKGEKGETLIRCFIPGAGA